MTKKKITLNELKTLVKKIIKEEVLKESKYDGDGIYGADSADYPEEYERETSYVTKDMLYKIPVQKIIDNSMEFDVTEEDFLNYFKSLSAKDKSNLFQNIETNDSETNNYLVSKVLSPIYEKLTTNTKIAYLKFSRNSWNTNYLYLFGRYYGFDDIKVSINGKSYIFNMTYNGNVFTNNSIKYPMSNDNIKNGDILIVNGVDKYIIKFDDNIKKDTLDKYQQIYDEKIWSLYK